jgi:hypothetical protein
MTVWAVYKAVRRIKKEPYGLEVVPEYHAWRGMMSRCYNPKSSGYKYYGGRGITVCERWKNSSNSFMEDMGPRPSPKHSVDRINNDGNYEPSNCRWATWKEQANNKGVRNRVHTSNNNP